MTDQQNTLTQDIAFIRAMAESGRDRPMAGGSILFACGLIFGLGSLIVWYLAAIQGMGGWMYSAVWGLTAVVFFITLPILLKRLPRSGGANQIAVGEAWSCLGGGVFVMALSLALLSARLQSPILMLAMPSILLAVYGGCWLLSAILLRQGWMKLVAFGSFAMALVNAWFAAGDAIWLIYGLSLLALLALPGAVMMRQARAAGG